ncbi:Uu.00g043890.m01.CDS01 [Anthostomella pinea]|uniref:Uu.00g043890.m01.CDS01 n=1 Tax=Anthostomella pinea TaxID=933095 RepID=A0AAI8VBV9_9PEZI|nr:Uu.00g043890.m01.CDS01 [Anthostomella pinea]
MRNLYRSLICGILSWPVFSSTPTIDAAWSTQQKQQLKDAHSDALQHASDEDDKKLVQRHPILHKHYGEGSDKLGDVKIKPDSLGLACTEPSEMMATRGFDTDAPDIIVCANTFAHSGIEKGYDKPKVQAINCDYIGNRVSWKMATLGSSLLHEYTHFTKLVVPPLVKETEDNDTHYGPSGARAIPKARALQTAVSYTGDAAVAAEGWENARGGDWNSGAETGGGNWGSDDSD